VVLASDLGIGKALSDDLAYNKIEPLTVGHFAVVVAKHLLIKVAKEMEGFNTHVGSMKAALQQAPEILHGVGMNRAVHVGYGVIDDLMSILRLESLIGFQVIAIEGRAYFNMLPHFS
jgi:hypothetical protein